MNETIPAPVKDRDPWIHRSEGMRCKSCMWFAPKAADIGRCRRHAPTMNGYPVVFVNDWCGDHKLNENWID
jgi:coenzyme F420-reducing hydrogenase beta subunit